MEVLLKLNSLYKIFATTANSIKVFLKKYAQYVEMYFGKRNLAKEQHRPVHIVAVGNYEEAIVYRLTVADAHLYYANGVLVTNTKQEDHAYDALRYGLTQARDYTTTRRLKATDSPWAKL